MSFSNHNEFDRSIGAIEAEKTLRQIATLPAPEGIEERVKAGLRTSPRTAQLVRWPSAESSRNSWIQNQAMRAAAAAAIVMVIAGGGWAIYSHIQLAPEPAAVTTPPHLDGHGGLSAAGTKRVPQTLEGPIVTIPVTKQKAESDSAAISSTHGKSTKKARAASQIQP
jgi:hypothetical protein